ncbi:hypothetical protein PLICRDRAFT_96595 [Plicaturopsis crispa FD-325 SS-3]|nr:hypothetical protein PLICRDRAFT_96595 [Plicaturopsis crispa FD-325 SS-3]
MPVDLPRNAAASRRSFRKLSTDEEIDIRRARGEISCAECRRLKLKCDKKLPCSSCVRRGCHTICPNGSLSTGQGTSIVRFVLADTEQLHHKIADMGQRIRQLEDALAIFQAGVSNDAHPLLRDELLTVKFGPDIREVLAQEPAPHATDVHDTIDAFGTLTIAGVGGDTGAYFGHTAGTEALLLAGADMRGARCLDDDESLPVSADVARLSHLFPFVSGGAWHKAKSLDILYNFLPPQPRAWSLCEAFVEQASSSFRPIQREELVEDFLIPIYKAAKEKQDNINPSVYISPHRLAVLYFVFAVGSLMDLTLPPYNVEAESWFQLGRSALVLRWVFDSKEIATVQALLLMGIYYSLAGQRYTLDGTWSLFSLAAKLSRSFHVDRDSARWNLDHKTVQRRRTLFWEIFSTETFYSLALGRPPCIRLSYVDCEWPEDKDQTIDKDGNHVPGVWAWRYMFAKEVLAPITEKTLTAVPPKYETILELDRKIRELMVPPQLRNFSDNQHITPSFYLQTRVISHFRSISMMYLHRSFFAQALLDHPANPLRSQYAPSFLATYRCASAVIKLSIEHYERFPDFCLRWWAIWTHLFSSAIIVGSIVTRSPSSSMAATAFVELGLAVELFEKGATSNRRRQTGLAILTRLREKAIQVYSQYQSGSPLPNVDRSIHALHEDGDDQLALFAGQTRVVVVKILSKQGQKHDNTLSAHNADASPSTSSQDSPPADVHPSLVEYLSLHPNANAAMTKSSGSAPPEHEYEHSPIRNDYGEQYTSHEDTSYRPFSPSPFAMPQQQPPESTLPPPPPPPPQYPPSSMPAAPSPAWSTPSHPSTIPTNGTFPVPTFEPRSAFFSPSQDDMAYGAPEHQSTVDSANFTDLDFLMAGESAMDESWISFMRESGFLGS